MNLKILFLMLFFGHILIAQSVQETDSLLAIVKGTKNDSIKVSVLNKVALNFINSDTDKAKAFQKQAENLAFSKKLKYGYNESVFVKGGIFVLSGISDSAFVYFKKAYDLALKNKFKPIQVRCINGFGMINWNKGNFDKALSYFFKALKLNESLPKNQKVNSSLFYNNIGLIYSEKRLFEKSLTYIQLAYEIRVKANMYKEQGISLNNLGICYMNLKKQNLAIEAFEKGKIITKRTNNTLIYYKIIHNLANLYADKSNYTKAIELYQEVLKKPNGLNENPRDVIILYGCISNTYSKMGLYDESLKYANLGLGVIKKHPEVEKYADVLYNALSKVHFHYGNIQKGDYYLIKYYDNIRNVFSEESKTAIAEMEVKYNAEKREKLLIQSKAVIEKRNLEIKNKSSQFIIVVVLGIGLLVIAYLLYYQQKLKNSQQKQEFELKSVISKIETQNKLQEQRLGISRDLHDNIGAQLTFIISSVDNIRYAFDITNEKLGNKLSTISSFAKETIIELRDTIWAMNSNEISFDDLETRINNYIEKAKEAKDQISFSFDIDPVLKPQKLTSVQGMNIYRTIQEAVNNAVKYADAKVISINATQVENQLKITIQDNGIGFDEATIEKGNGLQNMKKRIEEISGEFHLTSSNEGTKIEILL